MGPYSGGQAEYLRVPFADFICLELPEDAGEKENDYVMLSDIFPTGYHAVSHELTLEEAPEAYKHVDARDKGWTKVILKPGRQTAKAKEKKGET